VLPKQGDLEIPRSRKIVGPIVKIVGLGLSLAVVTNCAILFIQWRKSSPIATAYRQVALKMARPELIELLRRSGVRCGANESGTFDPIQCSFSDAWRAYTITFDKPDGLVTAKEFHFRPKPESINDLF
jgi:hypothetical protein